MTVPEIDGGDELTLMNGGRKHRRTRRHGRKSARKHGRKSARKHSRKSACKHSRKSAHN